MKRVTSRLSRNDVLETIEEAVAEGATADLEGGVPVGEIADRLDRPRNSDALRARLEELENRGEVVKVWGVSPDSGQPLTGYLPTDHPDAPG